MFSLPSVDRLSNLPDLVGLGECAIALKALVSPMVSKKGRARGQECLSDLAAHQFPTCRSRYSIQAKNKELALPVPGHDKRSLASQHYRLPRGDDDPALGSRTKPPSFFFPTSFEELIRGHSLATLVDSITKY